MPSPTALPQSSLCLGSLPSEGSWTPLCSRPALGTMPRTSCSGLTTGLCFLLSFHEVLQWGWSWWVVMGSWESSWGPEPAGTGELTAPLSSAPPGPREVQLPSCQCEHPAFSSLQATAINLMPALDYPHCQQGREMQLLDQLFIMARMIIKQAGASSHLSLCGVAFLAHTYSCVHLHHEWYKPWAATQQGTQGLQQ